MTDPVFVILPVPGPGAPDPYRNPGIVPPWLQRPPRDGRVPGGRDCGFQHAAGVFDVRAGEVAVVVARDGLQLRTGGHVGIDDRRAERATVGSFQNHADAGEGMLHGR